MGASSGAIRTASLLRALFVKVFVFCTLCPAACVFVSKYFGYIFFCSWQLAYTVSRASVGTGLSRPLGTASRIALPQLLVSCMPPSSLVIFGCTTGSAIGSRNVLRELPRRLQRLVRLCRELCSTAALQHCSTAALQHCSTAALQHCSVLCCSEVGGKLGRESLRPVAQQGKKCASGSFEAASLLNFCYEYKMPIPYLSDRLHDHAARSSSAFEDLQMWTRRIY